MKNYLNLCRFPWQIKMCICNPRLMTGVPVASTPAYLWHTRDHSDIDLIFSFRRAARLLQLHVQ